MSDLAQSMVLDAVRAEEPAKLTEPIPIPSTFCTGINADVGEFTTRLTCHEDLYIVGYDGAERRIVSRLVFTREVAHDLHKHLEAGLAKSWR